MAIKNTILFGLLLIFAYYGIKDNVVAIPFLQLFLSSLFLIELIYHIAFFFRLKNLCDKFKQIFSTPKSTKIKLFRMLYIWYLNMKRHWHIINLRIVILCTKN